MGFARAGALIRGVNRILKTGAHFSSVFAVVLRRWLGVLLRERLDDMRGVRPIYHLAAGALVQFSHLLDEVFLGHAFSDTANGEPNVSIVFLFLLLRNTLLSAPLGCRSAGLRLSSVAGVALA